MNSVQTRCIVKTSRFSGVFVEIGDLFNLDRGFLCQDHHGKGVEFKGGSRHD